jgi:hypothetical protein
MVAIAGCVAPSPSSVDVETPMSRRGHAGQSAIPHHPPNVVRHRE